MQWEWEWVEWWRVFCIHCKASLKGLRWWHFISTVKIWPGLPTPQLSRRAQQTCLFCSSCNCRYSSSCRVVWNTKLKRRLL